MFDTPCQPCRALRSEAWLCSVPIQPQALPDHTKGTSPVIGNVYLHSAGEQSIFSFLFMLFTPFWDLASIFFLLKRNFNNTSIVFE